MADSDVMERFRDALKGFKPPRMFKAFVSPVTVRNNSRRVSSSSFSPSPPTPKINNALSGFDKFDSEEDLKQQPDSTTNCSDHLSGECDVLGDDLPMDQITTSSPGKRPAEEERTISEENVASSDDNTLPPKRSRSMPPAFGDSDLSQGASGLNHSGITTTCSSDLPCSDEDRRASSVGPISKSHLGQNSALGPSPDPRIDEYFRMVAETGKTRLEWSLIRPAFLWKLRAVLEDFYKSAPFPNIPCRNMETIDGPLFIKKIVHIAEDRFFDGIPFTIQRLCELLTEPWAQYKRADKFFRAVEKNLCVVSTVDQLGRREVVPSLEQQDTEPMMMETSEAQALPVEEDDGETVPQANFTEIIESEENGNDMEVQDEERLENMSLDLTDSLNSSSESDMDFSPVKKMPGSKAEEESEEKVEEIGAVETGSSSKPLIFGHYDMRV